MATSYAQSTPHDISKWRGFWALTVLGAGERLLECLLQPALHRAEGTFEHLPRFPRQTTTTTRVVSLSVAKTNFRHKCRHGDFSSFAKAVGVVSRVPYSVRHIHRGQMQKHRFNSQPGQQRIHSKPQQKVSSHIAKRFLVLCLTRSSRRRRATPRLPCPQRAG